MPSFAPPTAPPKPNAPGRWGILRFLTSPLPPFAFAFLCLCARRRRARTCSGKRNSVYMYMRGEGEAPLGPTP